MNFKRIGAALTVLALAAMPALAFNLHASAGHSARIVDIAITLMVLGGAVTVTYKFPVSGATAPTAVQASQVPTVNGLVTWLESDTLGLFTHNMGIATAVGFPGIQPGLASFFPEVIITPVLNSGTVFPNIQIDYTTSTGNVLAFFKGSIAGTGGTVLLTVRRPHSIGL